MVCVGRKAQVLARRGMDIRAGNHPSRRRAFRPGVDQGGEYLAQPRTAQRVDVLIPTAVLHVMQAVLNAPVVAEQPEQFPWSRTAGNPGWSADTNAPGSPPRWLGPRSPSPPSPPASPREIPTHPGCSRPAGHRSRCAVSRSRPLFFQGLRLRLPRSLPGKPVGQCRQHRRLIPFDPHQVVPSVADYGLACPAPHNRSRSA